MFVRVDMVGVADGGFNNFNLINIKDLKVFIIGILLLH